jgi:predicted AAA+ superfamily ATPase
VKTSATPESSGAPTPSSDLTRLADALDRLVERVDGLTAAMQSARAGALVAPDWSTDASAFRARRRGGVLHIEPIRQVALVRLDALKEVDAQRERLVRNTAQFVAGRPANNVLLTGARGTGKSSLIKACLHEFAPKGLRLIEIDKADLIDLPEVIEAVAGRPERFVLYCDDLSFEDGDAGYKALKSALDGSITQGGDNVLIYATSNRRHLLPERMSDNLSTKYTDDGEIHPGEVVEEKISLSERFGVWISFYPFSQDEYLAIVDHWVRHFGVDPRAVPDLRGQALLWALERGSRSGRVAFQFARDLAGRGDSEARA